MAGRGFAQREQLVQRSCVQMRQSRFLLEMHRAGSEAAAGRTPGRATPGRGTRSGWMPTINPGSRGGAEPPGGPRDTARPPSSYKRGTSHSSLRSHVPFLLKLKTKSTKEGWKQESSSWKPPVAGAAGGPRAGSLPDGTRVGCKLNPGLPA